MAGYLTKARQDHPAVEAAFVLARGWCDGHVIDGGPALGHAVQVTHTLGQHSPDAPAYVVAASLLHDAPDLAPDRAEMAREITAKCGADVLSFIEQLHDEHTVLDQPTDANTAGHLDTLASVPWLMHTATADKIIALEYATGRAEAAEDPAVFWDDRPAFVQLVPYFWRIHKAGQGIIPTGMSEQYGRLLDRCP